MKLPKITTSELSAAQTEAFDWSRIDKEPSNTFADPPRDAITIMDVMKRHDTTDTRARTFLNAKVKAGEMETGLFKVIGAPGRARYYWWKKNATSLSSTKPKSSPSKKSGMR